MASRSQNRWRALAEVPARTPQSDALSKDLIRRGFRFVGSTIVYAFMQATGLVNDHLVGCPQWKALARLGKVTRRKAGEPNETIR